MTHIHTDSNARLYIIKYQINNSKTWVSMRRRSDTGEPNQRFSRKWDFIWTSKFLISDKKGKGSPVMETGLTKEYIPARLYNMDTKISSSFIHSINFYWAPIARRQASQVALVVKNLLQCRRRKKLELDPWTRKIPWRRKWQPIPVFSPGKFHVQRSLAGYSSWGCRESDTTEWLNVGTMLILQSRHLGGLYKVYIFQKDYWKIRLGQRQPGIDLRQNWMLG